MRTIWSFAFVLLMALWLETAGAGSWESMTPLTLREYLVQHPEESYEKAMEKQIQKRGSVGTGNCAKMCGTLIVDSEIKCRRWAPEWGEKYKNGTKCNCLTGYKCCPLPHHCPRVDPNVCWERIRRGALFHYTLGLDGLLYRRFPEKLTWKEANSRCKQDGATLAMIKTKSSFFYVRGSYASSSRLPLWVGVERPRRWFKFVDKIKVVYGFWRTGEPRRGRRLRCVAMNKGARWFTSNCLQRRPFLCQAPYGGYTYPVHIKDCCDCPAIKCFKCPPVDPRDKICRWKKTGIKPSCFVYDTKGVQNLENRCFESTCHFFEPKPPIRKCPPCKKKTPYKTRCGQHHFRCEVIRYLRKCPGYISLRKIIRTLKFKKRCYIFPAKKRLNPRFWYFSRKSRKCRPCFEWFVKKKGCPRRNPFCNFHRLDKVCFDSHPSKDECGCPKYRCNLKNQRPPTNLFPPREKCPRGSVRRRGTTICGRRRDICLRCPHPRRRPVFCKRYKRAKDCNGCRIWKCARPILPGLCRSNCLDHDWLYNVVRCVKKNRPRRPGYIYDGRGNYFKLYKERKTWRQAYRYCRKDGGSLLIIFNKAMLDFVKSRFFGLHIGVTWIGMTDQFWEGDFRWCNGYRAPRVGPLSRWLKKPKNLTGKEDCVDINTEKDFGWNARNCREKHFFICQWRNHP